MQAATSASLNIAVGKGALQGITTGLRNVAIGHCSLSVASVCSSNNVAIGGNAGTTLSNGCNNVLLGACVQPLITNGSCQLSIGFSGTDNWLTGTSTKAIKPGAGIIDCANSCGTDGQVLMSNGANAICWGGVPGATPATPTVAGILLGCTTATQSAVGCNALVALTTGLNNSAVGFEALKCNQTGANNTAFGHSAGSQITGSSNTLIGSLAGKQISSGGANTGLGRNALCSATTAASNTALGTDAMLSVSGGQSNTGVGTNVMGSATGSGNVAIGAFAGCNLTTGSRNVIIGCAVTVDSPTGNCQLAIGFSSGCNWLTGNSTQAIKPGAGIIDCANSCGNNGQVLMSNGANAVCWGGGVTGTFTFGTCTVTICNGLITSVA
jgi:hypothetical protein